MTILQPEVAKTIARMTRLYYYPDMFQDITEHTGCPILKVAPEYFFNKAFSEKMFQTKVVWIKGEHKRVSLI